MNSLDLLFEFAALMSSSSAMQLSPGTSNDPPNPETQTSEVLSTMIAPVNSSRLREAVQNQPPQQIGAGNDSTSMPQIGDDVGSYCRPRPDSATQQPIDWIPAPHVVQQQQIQRQYTLMPEHPQLTSSEVFALGYDDFCLSHPSQRCDCTRMPPPSTSFQHSCMLPDTWNYHQTRLQDMEPELYRLQSLPTEGLSCIHGCVEHGPEQLCACPRFPPQSYWNNGGYLAGEPHSTHWQHGDSRVGMYPENKADFVQHD